MNEEENVSEDVPESVPKERSQREKLREHVDEGTVEAFDASKCPIIEPHVVDFQTACKDFAEGKCSDLDVVLGVVETLRKLKKQ